MVGRPIGDITHADRGQRVGHALGQRLAPQPLVGRAERHVLPHGGEEQLIVWVLEDQANLGADTGQGVRPDLVAGDPDRPGLRKQQSVEVVHQRGLAGPVRAEHRHPLPRPNGQVDAEQ